MHRAALADEGVLEPAKHALGLRQNAPKALGEVLI
jgi:hypothetical protein